MNFNARIYALINLIIVVIIETARGAGKWGKSNHELEKPRTGRDKSGVFLIWR